ncbi:MFS transporter [Cellulomonas marina]|uniref:Drug resistance transporter, EmrB/QacA subfamily n=1 Tax=Cellulomonas marina TaxID=988821 RepID=A0A1I0WQV5_9CELL|nr:MFS transporter [Cellulomonas marina]GIG27788.1 MFS transporter [Cellulomonas marina]SFA90540.1 drug resistance transporter, EmrB/QacA subfamily [Cellulomonas marina]
MPDERPVPYRSARGRWVLTATVLGSALAFVDATVVIVALPHLAADLGAGTAQLQWTVNGYGLTLAAFLLLGGSLGDRWGRRRVFLVGVVWFAVASLACALAPSAEALVAARVVQGVGGALLTPGSLAILQSTFAGEDRARAIGAWSGLGAIAGALAPFLGGWIVDSVSWRWIFAINLPLAALVVVAALRHVPETRQPGGGRLDVAGTVVGAGGLAAVTWGFTRWADEGAAGPDVVVALALGAATLVAFVLVERRATAPLVPVGLFRWRPFAATNASTFVVYAALSGLGLFLTTTLQVVAGWSALAAGIASLPMTLLLLLGSPTAGALGARLGPRLPMTVGPVVAAGGLVLLAGVGADADYLTDVLPGVVLVGLGLTTLVAPLTTTALAAAPDALAGTASGVNNAVARVAGLLAVAVLPLVAGVGSGLTNPTVLAPAHRTAMLVCAALMLAGAALAAGGIPGTTAAVRPPPDHAPTDIPTDQAPTDHAPAACTTDVHPSASRPSTTNP